MPLMSHLHARLSKTDIMALRTADTLIFNWIPSSTWDYADENGTRADRPASHIVCVKDPNSDCPWRQTINIPVDYNVYNCGGWKYDVPPRILRCWSVQYPCNPHIMTALLSLKPDDWLRVEWMGDDTTYGNDAGYYHDKLMLHVIRTDKNGKELNMAFLIAGEVGRNDSARMIQHNYGVATIAVHS